MTGCFWPKPAPHAIASERLLSVKAGAQNHQFGKLVDEWLVSARKQPLR